MQNPEYRTMRFRGWGDDPETDFGMIGHGVTGLDTGCPMPIAGYDIRCPRGAWWASVKSKVTSDQ